MKYDDNTKYLFEYVNQHYSDKIRAVWLSRQQNVVVMINKMGLEAYRAGSFMGLWLQLRAGVAIYTNSLFDFGICPLIGGAEVVTTWHGMSFKKIYNSYSFIFLGIFFKDIKTSVSRAVIYADYFYIFKCLIKNAI